MGGGSIKNDFSGIIVVMNLLHLLPLSDVRAGRGPLCQPHLLWAHCPLAPRRTSGCPVG